jgi:hypothetical protein
MTTIATTPASRIAVPPATERMIAARWETWIGPVTAWMKVVPTWYGTDAVRLRGRESDHREWLLTLLHRGIPMYAIRRLNLDDPREARLVQMARAERYQEKSRRRMPYGTNATRTGNEQGTPRDGASPDHPR